MKSDIDRLMAERDLDALIVFGGEGENPHRLYLTGGHEANATIFKRRDHPAAMLTNSMEIENAKMSGMEVVTYDDLKLFEVWGQYRDDPDMALVKTWERYFERFGITAGRVGVYGFGSLGAAWEILKLFSQHFPALEFVGERRQILFDVAVATKDADEIKHLRDVGQRTNLVMQATWDFIGEHRADGDTVVKADGAPLTIGDVKRFVRIKLLEYGLEDPEGMIFAQGRDAGFPHSHGTDGDPLQLGQAIVFDLFPRDMVTRYFHDMTRTWSIGHATPEVQKAFDEVMTAVSAAMSAYKVGEKTSRYQEIVLDALEECGHPTGRSDPGTQVGYTHSLGHGLGMQVHESPSFSHLRDEDVLQVGNVFTIEPGIYYPDKGFGIRVEDTIYVAEDGTIHNLTPMHKELVLPLQG
jgi:Xaa-Pro aminopeptidase